MHTATTRYVVEHYRRNSQFTAITLKHTHSREDATKTLEHLYETKYTTNEDTATHSWREDATLTLQHIG